MLRIFICAILCNLFLAVSISTAEFQSLYVENGTLYYEDGNEVVFWGVNLQPSLSWEYNRMKRHGLHDPFDKDDYKAMIDEAYDELEIMGVNLIRIHLSPGDITDKEGNLVENRWLDLTDYVLAEAEKRGMYTYLAFLNTLGVARGKDTFISRSNQTKPMWMVDPVFIQKSERFMHQLLNRKNSYLNDIKYKNSPALALVEPINEPGYFSRETIEDFPDCFKIYEDWIDNHERLDDENAFYNWRMITSKSYINRMVDFFKKEEVRAPMVWSMEWPRMMEWTGKDVFEAAAESDAPIVSVCFYPGQSVAYGKKGNDLKLVGEENYFEYISKSYNLQEWHGWLREDRFRGKARIVYEFETYYNQRSYLYPLMAKYFRAQGIQAAAMWTYLLPVQAEYTAAAHHLNLKTTPHKAAAFMAAGAVMYEYPRYLPYKTTSSVDDFSKNLALSYVKGSSAYADSSKLIYSDGLPKEFSDRLHINTESLNHIVGCGQSPVANYEGSGLYIVNRIDDKKIELIIMPESKFIIPHYLPNERGEKVVDLNRNKLNTFTLNLKDCSKQTVVYRLEKGKLKKINQYYKKGLHFKAKSGKYLIYNEAGGR